MGTWPCTEKCTRPPHISGPCNDGLLLDLARQAIAARIAGINDLTERIEKLAKEASEMKD